MRKRARSTRAAACARCGSATKSRGGVVLFEADLLQHLQGMIDSFPLIRVDYADHQILLDDARRYAERPEPPART